MIFIARLTNLVTRSPRAGVGAKAWCSTQLGFHKIALRGRRDAYDDSLVVVLTLSERELRSRAA